MKKLLVLGSLVAGLAVSPVAAAQPEGGASVHVDSSCTTSAFAIVCVDTKLVTKLTTTPSGNRSYVTNGSIEQTLTSRFSDCTVSHSQPVHLHWLQKDGELQSQSQRIATTTQVDCGGIVQTCTSTLEFHYAGGEVQFSRSDRVCTSP